MASQNYPTQHDDDTMYRMPESGYEQLLMIRNQLRLLSTLIQPVTQAEERESRDVPVDALAQGFALLAGQLDGILETLE